MVYGALVPMPEILIELRMKRTVKFYVSLPCCSVLQVWMRKRGQCENPVSMLILIFAFKLKLFAQCLPIATYISYNESSSPKF